MYVPVRLIVLSSKNVNIHMHMLSLLQIFCKYSLKIVLSVCFNTVEIIIPIRVWYEF